MSIEAFKFDRNNNKLRVLDQTKLPTKIEHVQVRSSIDGHRVIKDMLVRGAPCIAAVGCLSLVVQMNELKRNNSMNMSLSEFQKWFNSEAAYMMKSRPTAVNLSSALSKLIDYIDFNKQNVQQVSELIDRVSDYCSEAITNGLNANYRLSGYGSEALIGMSPNDYKLKILTHCNTGSLATVGYGTALGVIKSIYSKNRLERAYCTETRPYNQGSRLTAWELVQENIPATLIADDMVAYLMATNKIDGVVVGADRVLANGDTANKIGTLQIAITSLYYRVPFYVAAPTQSIDLTTANSDEIDIEERPADELRKFGSQIQLAPESVEVWNPCFDITPSHLIRGIITEFGICRPNEIRSFLSNVQKGSLSCRENALF